MRSKTLPGLIFRFQDQVDELGQVAAHRRGAAVQADVGEEQLRSPWNQVELTPCGTPTKPTSRPGGSARIACIIDSCVPTHSSTESAPSPRSAP